MESKDAAADTASRNEGTCYDLWKGNNTAIEVAYSVMCLLFVFQGVYASLQRSKIAIHFDIVFAIYCTMPLAIVVDQHWLVQILLSFQLLANFYIVYKLRDLQMIGTSWVFVLVYLVLTLVFMLLSCIGSLVGECSNRVLMAAGYAGFIALQLINIFILFTLRQNSLANYKRLPIWLVTTGSIANLCLLALLEYQVIFLNDREVTDVPDNFKRLIKSMYIVGLLGPIMFWIFVYFLIARVNDKVSRDSNPNFLESTEREEIEDNDDKALVNHSGNLSPVQYNDLRWDYSSKSNDSPNAAGTGLAGF